MKSTLTPTVRLALDATAAGQLLEGFRPSRLAGHA